MVMSVIRDLRSRVKRKKIILYTQKRLRQSFEMNVLCFMINY